MEKDMRPVLGALTLILATAPAMAQTMTGPVNVTMIRTGWNADAFAVVTLQPIANPSGCPIADGYVAQKPQPGYATYYDASLLAFDKNARVQVTVADAGCIAGRPKLIGINLLR
jgi:hypothetical protein